MPAAYFVFGDGILMGRGGSNQASIIFRTNGTGMYVIKVAWSGNTLSFSSTPAASQLNVPDTEYVVLGLYAES